MGWGTIGRRGGGERGKKRGKEKEERGKKKRGKGKKGENLGSHPWYFIAYHIHSY